MTGRPGSGRCIGTVSGSKADGLTNTIDMFYRSHA